MQREVIANGQGNAGEFTPLEQQLLISICLDLNQNTVPSISFFTGKQDNRSLCSSNEIFLYKATSKPLQTFVTHNNL